MSRIYVLKDEIDSGKTSTALKWAKQYQNEGKSVGGILAQAIINDDRKTGYPALNLETGEKKLMASMNKIENEGKISCGRFHFSEEGVRFANHVLSEMKNKPDVVFIDEVGPLELKEKGLARGIRNVLKNPPSVLFLIVRKSLVEQVCQYFQIENPDIIDTKSSRP